MGINNNTWNRIRYSIYQPIYDLVAKNFYSQRQSSIKLLNLQKGEKVLILGAGTGLDLEFMPKSIEISAIDITPAMVGQMKARANSLGIQGDFQVMDGHKLTYPDATFDCVILHLILAVIPDPYMCIAEVERVLKPQGRGVIFDKFVADGKEPSFIRKLANLATNALFSDINRSLGDIISNTSLKKLHQEPAGFGGNFQIVLVKKN